MAIRIKAPDSSEAAPVKGDIPKIEAPTDDGGESKPEPKKPSAPKIKAPAKKKATAKKAPAKKVDVSLEAPPVEDDDRGPLTLEEMDEADEARKHHDETKKPAAKKATRKKTAKKTAAKKTAVKKSPAPKAEADGADEDIDLDNITKKPTPKGLICDGVVHKGYVYLYNNTAGEPEVLILCSKFCSDTALEVLGERNLTVENGLVRKGRIDILRSQCQFHPMIFDDSLVDEG